MKKSILFLVTILIISCSSNEEDERNPLYGKWRLEAQFDKDGVNKNISDCKRQTNVTFYDDNTFKNIGYHIENNNCVKDEPSGVTDFILEGNRISFGQKKIQINFINNNLMEIIEIIDERNNQAGEWFGSKDLLVRIK